MLLTYYPTKSAHWCYLLAPTCASCLWPPTTNHYPTAQVGGFHIFHREDLRAIAPKWLGYTRKARALATAHPDTDYLLTNG